jgi:Domain of unknown function (DUF1918)
MVRKGSGVRVPQRASSCGAKPEASASAALSPTVRVIQLLDQMPSDFLAPAAVNSYAQRAAIEGRSAMTFQVGDRVVAEAESTERRPRSGTVREVLREDPAPRYRIEWDDGHSSIYTPAAGALHAERAQAEASG